MKRFLSILLVAMLVVTSLATVAFAAGTATVSVSTVNNANPGDEVTVTFTVSGEFANYEMTLKYDSALTLVDISGVVGNPANGKVAHATAENISSHSFSATFKVPENAEKCSYPVSATVSFISDRNLVDQEYTVSGGSINLSHAWDGGVVTTKPTCDSKGVMTYTCERCGATYTEDIAPLAHDYDDGVVTTKPTCDTKGVMTYTCKNCGHTYTEEIAALGHDYDDGVVTTAATCTAKGVKTYTCKVCKHTYTTEIAMLAHNISEVWELNTEMHWHECSMCHAHFDEDAHDPQYLSKEVANKKVTEYWTCSVCGYNWTKTYDDKYDDEPQTGDITEYVVLGTLATVVTLAGAVMFITKRKAVK